jgi:hypothetical protein
MSVVTQPKLGYGNSFNTSTARDFEAKPLCCFGFSGYISPECYGLGRNIAVHLEGLVRTGRFIAEEQYVAGSGAIYSNRVEQVAGFLCWSSMPQVFHRNPTSIIASIPVNWRGLQCSLLVEHASM